jgi:hypothetical protein
MKSPSQSISFVNIFLQTPSFCCLQPRPFDDERVVFHRNLVMPITRFPPFFYRFRTAFITNFFEECQPVERKPQSSPERLHKFTIVTLLGMSATCRTALVRGHSVLVTSVHIPKKHHDA